MAEKTYEVLDTNNLNIGTEVSPRMRLLTTGAVVVPGTLEVTGAATLTGGITGPIAPSTFYVETFEKVTTTGSSDEADPAVSTTILTSGGAHTVSLADGTVDGQVKKIFVADVASGTLTITPDNFANGTSMTMAEAYDCVTLIWDATTWRMIAQTGVAII